MKKIHLMLVVLFVFAVLTCTSGVASAYLGTGYVGNTMVDFSWDEYENTDFSKYVIYRGGSRIATITNRTVSFYRDTGLTKGNTYDYEIRVYDTTGVLKETRTTRATTGEVHGTIRQDTTWTAASSPYTLTGDLLRICDGATLTIAGGVQVSSNNIPRYWSDISVREKGTLNADGSRFCNVSISVYDSHADIKNCFLGFASIRLDNSNDSAITDNIDCGYVIVSHSSNNAITGNTARRIQLTSSNNNAIRNNNISNSKDYGIYLSRSSDNVITSNTVSNSSLYGIYLQFSSNNVVRGNNVSDNQNYGISLRSSNINPITGNNVSDNRLRGISLSCSSDNNRIIGNNVSNNDGGGIYLCYDPIWDFTANNRNNIITDNTVANNRLRGIYLYSSSDNVIANNTVSNNRKCGISLYSSSDNNSIYNNYFSNTNNSYDNGNNTWNITKTAGTNIVGGPYLGGNYWCDYKGTDLDGDGLGDTPIPYNCSGRIQNGGDYRPLIKAGLNLEILYPRGDFLVLENLDYRIIVKVTDALGKGVKDVRLKAEITSPYAYPFDPRREDGEYIAVWRPRSVPDEAGGVGECTIKVTATPKGSGRPVSKSVTGTVDPEIEITDIGPNGVYHTPGRTCITSLRGNTYDPLWDDNPVDPSDDDYVKFTYELNKDVDKVIITEYKDILGPCNEQIGSKLSYKNEKYTSKGKHEYYMNVKNLDEDQYYIEVETSKEYDRGELPIYNERGSEDCAWDRLHIIRGSFAQIYIEKVADVAVGKISEEDLKENREKWQGGRDFGQLLITTALGFYTPWLWVPAGFAAFFVNFDDPDTLGCIKENWNNGNLKELDKAEVVRFTGRVYGWDGDTYRSGYPEYDRCWLNGEFIYSNLYRTYYDQEGKPQYGVFEFLEHSRHDFLGKKQGKRWYVAFYEGLGSKESQLLVPWWPFKFQNATFLGLNKFWGWSVPTRECDRPNNAYYSKVYFKRYFRHEGTHDLFEGKLGVPNAFHGRDTSNPSLSGKSIRAFESISSDVAFTGLYADHVTDTDGDGLYDCLTLEVGLRVTTPGYYTLQGALADATGELVGMETKGAELPSGLQMLELDFNGMSIHQNEINGTYSLMYLDLYNENWDEMDSRSNFTQGIYTTAAYNYTEFQGPSISFTDIYSEETADTDSDGSYDYLTIDVEVNVCETGNYTIVGWLSGGGLRSIVQSQNSSQLNSGLHEIQLSFDGKIISQNGIDGPYTLNLAAYDESFHILGHSCDAYTTAAYHGSDFQGIPAEFNDVYSDQGIDTNSDGLYDYLIIDVAVEVTKAGNYTLSGQLVDTVGIFVASADTETSLDVGTHTLHLNFDGQVIRRRGVDGAFNLSASLYKWDTLTLIDEMFNEYTTAVYSHMDFQAPPAEFTANFSDQGRDTDGDGLYNYLTVGVEVAASAPGHYTISGELFDSSGLHVRSTSSYITLDNGAQTVQLDFDGQSIRGHGVNGPYNLKGLTLYDEAGDQIDYQDIAYTTSLYNYIDFQTLPAEFNDIFSDYGTDTNGDGKYNYLTVELWINIATPGNYAITGRLNDCNGNYTGWSANHSFFDVGAQTVQLNFDGQTIRQHGVDGPYNLTYLEIYNVDVRDIDHRDDVYTTSAYSYIDFERPSAQFNDIFSDHGTDLDDDGLYDHLTVDVGVNVTEGGNYSLEGRLADNDGNFIVPAYNYTGVDAGSQTLQLNFEGPAIRKHGMDGQYNVIYLRLCDESGETIDSRSDADTTFAYNYSQFEGYPLDLSLLESDITFDLETLTAGETAIITATIRNTGTDDVSSVVVQFFDGNPNAGGDQIDSDQTVSSIPSGDAGSAQIYWTAIPGTHDIFVRVDPYDSIQEANENNNQAHKPITIEQTYNQPPIASFMYSPLNPVVNETIMFNATNSYDPDGFIVNYEWNFGDDIAATGEIVEHSYSKPGDYTVILRVTDNDNVSNTNTMILTVTMVGAAVCGDVTGDNNVTMGDTRRIEMWLLYPVDYPINNLWAADVTGDGEVTGDDARRIIMWLSDPEQYPLACSTP